MEEDLCLVADNARVEKYTAEESTSVEDSRMIEDIVWDSPGVGAVWRWGSGTLLTI